MESDNEETQMFEIKLNLAPCPINKTQQTIKGSIQCELFNLTCILISLENT